MQIVKISPKGQITIPKEFRDQFLDKNLALEVTGKTITLKPVHITVIDDSSTDNLEKLAESSLDFWQNSQDDVYENYYLDQKNEKR